MGSTILPHLKRCSHIAFMGIKHGMGSGAVAQLLRELPSWDLECATLERVTIIDPLPAKRESWGLQPVWDTDVHQIRTLEILGFKANRFSRVAIDHHFVSSGLRSLKVVGNIEPGSLAKLLQQCLHLRNFEWTPTDATDIASGTSRFPRQFVLRELISLKLSGPSLKYCDPLLLAPHCEQLILNNMVMSNGVMGPLIFRDDVSALAQLKQCQLYHAPDDLSVIQRWLIRHPNIEQVAFTCLRVDRWPSWWAQKRSTIAELFESFIPNLLEDEKASELLPDMRVLAYEMSESDVIWETLPNVHILTRAISRLLLSRPALEVKLFIRLDNATRHVENAGGSKELPRDLTVPKAVKKQLQTLIEASRKIERLDVVIGGIALDWSWDWNG
ncbi:hypothetical protein DL93DRAFT_2086581 [Clavulina sp. PMI_390]|nr:hypothetical protein DL93DRAFT_2086581 [Clavulina sp. PMI_390]